MFRKTGLLASVLTLALAAAIVPAAVAQPGDEAPPARAEIRDAFERLWAAFRGLFDPRSGSYRPAVAADCELGSIMDPNGCPRSQSVCGDSGSIMDPNGCPQAQLGSIMDPDG